MNERLRGLATYPMVRLDELKAEVLARGVRVFDFGTGDPREPTPPAIRDACRDGIPAVSQYPKFDGRKETRQAIAGYLQRRFGVAVDADREVLTTMGSKEAIFHLPMVVLDPSTERDTVVYGVPAYPVFEIGSLFAEAQVHEVALGPHNGYLLRPEHVPDEVLARTALVFLNYPHNPTGTVMPADVFEAWVAARGRHGFTLVSDECYVDLHYREPAPRSLLEFGREGCLAVHSCSKRSGMTGYRSGFVAGDAALIAHYRRFRAGMGLTPQGFVESAAEVSWRDEAHVAERRATFARKRGILLALFAELGLEPWPCDAGLFLWVRVPTGETGWSYAERLLQCGILVSPGPFFGPGQESFVRLALVPTLDECRATAAAWPRP